MHDDAGVPLGHQSRFEAILRAPELVDREDPVLRQTHN
jgi:hypothetical protein